MKRFGQEPGASLLVFVNISWIEGELIDPIYYFVNLGLDFAVVRENFILEEDSFPLMRIRITVSILHTGE